MTKRVDDGDEADALDRLLLDQLADKWTIRVLCAFHPDMKPIRFNELKRRVGVITQKMLSHTLRRLERNGVLERRVLAGRELGVEYHVTALGRTLREPILALYRWTQQHADRVRRAQAAFDAKAADDDRRH